jgi:hypothetical protein
VEEHVLLGRALEFSERVAGDVMVPRSELVTVPENSTPEQVERVVAGPATALPGGCRGRRDGRVPAPEGPAVRRGGAVRRPIPQARVRSLVSLASADEVEDAWR